MLQNFIVAWLDPQRVLVLAVVLIAAIYVVRRIFRAFTRKQQGSCSTCSGCPTVTESPDADACEPEEASGCCLNGWVSGADRVSPTDRTARPRSR